jgi:phosphoribosylformimino-5-aminoimidazole carboxamide ribotide isomerase
VILYPAVDIKGGAAVRLVQGDMSRETRYDDRPEDAARRWASEGAEWLHVVDLDGAMAGEPRNLDAIGRILEVVSIPVQVGGGVRRLETVQAILGLGVARVVLGTAVLADPGLVREAAERFPGRVALGLDARGGKIAVRGWVETSDESAVDVARRFDVLPLGAIVYTDIEVDGTLRGPNLAATEALARAVRTPVIASGGIGSLEDLRRVAALGEAGVAGAIVGRALYTGDVRLRDALALARPSP